MRKHHKHHTTKPGPGHEMTNQTFVFKNNKSLMLVKYTQISTQKYFKTLCEQNFGILMAFYYKIIRLNLLLQISCDKTD